MRTSLAWRFAVVATATVMLPAVSRGEDPPPARVVERIHAEGDFIDDPFALSPAGDRIAYITTDGATRSKLHVATVGDRKSDKAFAYGSITPERVEFLDEER